MLSPAVQRTCAHISDAQIGGSDGVCVTQQQLRVQKRRSSSRHPAEHYVWWQRHMETGMSIPRLWHLIRAGGVKKGHAHTHRGSTAHQHCTDRYCCQTWQAAGFQLGPPSATSLLPTPHHNTAASACSADSVRPRTQQHNCDSTCALVKFVHTRNAITWMKYP